MIPCAEFADIKESRVLLGLDDQDLERLAAQCELRTMAEGTTVFIENMPGESLFIVKTGAIRVSRMFAEADEKTLLVLGPGDVFGEMAVIDGLPRSATARVAEDARLICLGKPAFDKLVGECPETALKIVMNLTRVFIKRVRDAQDDYREMLSWAMQPVEKG
ncbi:MAG: cyclic nucleotide-binding domain-containing protein [Desulfuromonadales bacterium]|nr:cyclic nucleotide-binding domain-containing protein [Desulfuromonadales bacterium]